MSIEHIPAKARISWITQSHAFRGKVAWKMLAEVDVIIGERMNNSNWSVYVAELMLNWIDRVET